MKGDRVIVPMLLPNEEPAVRGVALICTPSEPDRPPGWYLAHPTLVLYVDDTLIGYTAFSVAPAPACPHLTEGGEVMYGHGLSVLPAYRNLGHGWALAEARRQIGRGLGLRVFVGMTQPDNVGMIRIFERQGAKPFDTIPSAYPGGAAGVVYAGGLQ